MNKETDYMYQLVDYVKKNLKKGYTKDSLRIALTKQGHSRLSIENAMLAVEKEMASTAPVMKAKMLPPTEAQAQMQMPVVEKKSFWQKLFG